MQCILLVLVPVLVLVLLLFLFLSLFLFLLLVLLSVGPPHFENVMLRWGVVLSESDTPALPQSVG